MDLSNKRIGYGITGSFCTFEKTLRELKRLVDMGARVTPIFSYNAQTLDTRFTEAKNFVENVCDITKSPGMFTIQEAEPVGPKKLFEVMIIAPCTGNTAAKLCNGIIDTPVLMAAKAHLRNQKPLVIALATNDALGINFKTIGNLMNMKNIFFVPFGQDDCEKKPKSLVCHMELIPETVQAAFDNRQLQPVIRT